MIDTDPNGLVVGELCEPFEDRIDILFHELELATRWHRPSLLLAIYSSDYIRSDANIALENRLHKLGQSAYHIKVKNQAGADISSMISELSDIENVVFFVEGLRWGSGDMDANAYCTLNKSREFFIENQVRIVFWLTEREAIDLAHHAPDYWSFRHRVIEFVDSPSPEQIGPHMIESAWKCVGECTDSNEDLDAKIALRSALLTDLPDGNESTSARANLLLTLGVLHWRRGDFEKASQFLNNALDQAATLEDNRFEALCFNALALVKTSLGRHADAIQFYQNAISLAPERICPWNNLGNLYRKLDRHPEALVAFQKAIDQDPKDAIGWNGLGNTYHSLGQNDEAIYAFRRAIEHSPNFAGSWCSLGQVYLSEGQLEPALAAHQKAVKLDRRSASAWLGLGRVFKHQDRLKNARIAFETALELEPAHAEAWSEMGEIASKAGAYDEATHAYRKALEFGQPSVQVYRALASILILQGNHQETLPLFQKGIALSQDVSEKAALWNQLGDSYRILDDLDNAIESYRQADQLDPEASGPRDSLPPIPAPPPETPLQPDSTSLDALSDPDFLRPELVQLLQPEQPEQPDQLDQPEQPAGSQEPQQSEFISTSTPDTLPTSDESIAVPPAPEPAFTDWLDGLATVQPVHETPVDMQPLPSTPPSSVSEPQPEPDPELPTLASPDVSESEPEKEPLDFDPLPAGDTSPQDLPSTPDEEKAKAPDSSVDIDNAHIWMELGNIYCNTQAYEEAIQAFEKAIALDPANSWAYNNLASLYFHLGRYAEAIPLYQKSIQYAEQTSDKTLFWNRLGDTYRHMNAHDEAAMAYQKAMKNNPEKVSLLARARLSLLGNLRICSKSNT